MSVAMVPAPPMESPNRLGKRSRDEVEQSHYGDDTNAKMEEDTSESLRSSPLSLPPASSLADATSLSGSISTQSSRQTSPTFEVQASKTQALSVPTTQSHPNKKRKLTASEKAEKQREKEAKDQEKAAQKSQREEERRRKEEDRIEKKKIKDEEKKARDEERRVKEEEKRRKEEEKAKVKDEEKRAKDEEKRRKEEEKAKKDRSQLSLTAFLSKPSSRPALAIQFSATSPQNRVSESPERGTLTPMLSGSNTPSKLNLSDYHRTFPPFFVQSHTIIAPHNKFCRDPIELDSWRAQIDSGIDESREPQNRESGRLNSNNSNNIKDLCRVPNHKRSKRGKNHTFTTKTIISWIQGTQEPHELKSRELSKQERSNALLKMLPIKHLKYAEDVRPPYWGTFSMKPNNTSQIDLARNPFKKAISQLNYDYDSEAEWEEPEDGEELNSEGDDDVTDDDGDEMDGFLDDEGVEGPAKTSRPMINGDLKPLCTGICWEGIDGKLVAPPKSIEEIGHDPFNCRMEILLDNANGSIDPFSNSYWTPISKSSMEPPRVPLSNISKSGTGINAYLGQRSLVDAKGNAIPENLVAIKGRKTSKASSKQIDETLKEDFKQFVDGSDLTKMALIEALKKRFPKVSKDVLKDTLNTVAARVGIKEVDKRWTVLKSP